MIAYLLVVQNALAVAHEIGLYNYVRVYPQIQTALYLKTLPGNSFVYVSSGFSDNPGNGGLSQPNGWAAQNASGFVSISNYMSAIMVDAYTGFAPAVNYSVVAENCSQLKGGYMVGVVSPFELYIHTSEV